jgi:hypothetical protein
MPRKNKGTKRDPSSQGQSPISAASSNPDSPRVAFSSHVSPSQSPKQVSSTQSSPTASPVQHLQVVQEETGFDASQAASLGVEQEFALSVMLPDHSTHGETQSLAPMAGKQEQLDYETPPQSHVHLGQEVTNEIIQAMQNAPSFAQSFSPRSGGTSSPVLDHESSNKQTTVEVLPTTTNRTCFEHLKSNKIENTQSSKTQGTQKKSQNKVLIDKLIEITKTYQSHLQTQQSITTHDEEGKLADKVRIINDILAQLNQVTDSDKLKIFRQSLADNKDILSKHRTGQGERYLQLASIICFSAIAIAVPAITISLEIGLVMLAATLSLIAAVSIYQRIETNSWNFFAPRGQLYCEQAERHLPSCS